ncbi:WD repeat-containing protein on Y chromosome [Erpetoichthys calabaricus]|uniref:WD repeat-containing protein on Y chromosome n=1 Tax=Erpetoichthys calabaricus TaxID=27687 RepID=UPI00223468A9|nr:WD repeat-containing protein on Y chromosome [Erpetoichthys calabaricus]
MPLPQVLQKRSQALQRRLLWETTLAEVREFLKKEGEQKRGARHESFSSDEKILRFDQEQNVRLEEELQLSHLRRLEEVFSSYVPLGDKAMDENGGRTNGRKPGPPRQPGCMTLAEFQETLTSLVGSEKWADQMELLFNKVDTSCDGYVDWDEFCTYMLMRYKEKDYVNNGQDTTFTSQPLIKHCLHNKQEVTTRMLAVPSPSPLRFVSVSKEGILTIWDCNLQIQKSCDVCSKAADSQTGRRRFKTWATDAVYMANVHKIAVATTSRDIHFFDISTSNCFEEFHLFALTNVPTCLFYWCKPKAPESCSLLLWGDDAGNVNLMWFLRPLVGMFEKPFTEEEGPQKVFMQEIKEHHRLVSHQCLTGIHPQPISKIMYVPDGDLVITSSGSPSMAVHIMDIQRKKKTYTWKISKGVTCFDFSKPLNLLVTGGMDHMVRLWNQYVTSGPVAILQGHCVTLLDVAIYEPLSQIFSYSKDAVLKVWSITSQRCLKTLVLKFPSVLAGHILEHGEFPFLLVKSTPSALLVSCGDYIGLLQLQKADSEDRVPATHNGRVSAAAYNFFFHQVVTTCEDSSLAVWDVETGAKFLQLNNVHGKEEITCVSFDVSQRHLITGAWNGTIKIWNIQNGHSLHKLQPLGEAEVTGLISFQEHRLLAIGWNKKLALYNMANPEDVHIMADISWLDGQLHKEDILAVDYCPSLGLVATGSFDGEIIVWNLERQRVVFYLRKSPSRRPTTARSAKKGQSACRSRCSSKANSTHSGHNDSPAPVDKLLFLQHRATSKTWISKSILVSSEAGELHWWSLSGSRHSNSYFYAPAEPEESVLTLSTDELNRYLVSGDTAGTIRVWNITDYGLQIIDQKSSLDPPLLFSWKAHLGTIVSAQHFSLHSQSFIMSASADQTARIWTLGGKFVGTFGQEKRWNLENPSTYQHPRNPWGQVNKVETKQNGAPVQTDLGTEESPAQSSKDKSHRYDAASLGQEFTIKELRDASCYVSTSRSLSEHGCKAIPSQTLPSVSIHQCKSSFDALFEEDPMKKICNRQARRSMFGRINAQKLCRFGGVCTPFQVLATPDMEEFILPNDLPGSNWMSSHEFKQLLEPHTPEAQSLERDEQSEMKSWHIASGKDCFLPPIGLKTDP